MSAGATTEIVTEAERLAALAPQWWVLWRRCAATPFQSPAWLLPWWETFAPGALRCIAVHEDGQLIALAPLYLEKGPLGARLLPLGVALSDWFDVLVAPGSAGALGALAAALASLQGWESVWLQDLPPDAAALALPEPAGASSCIEAHEACPVLSIEGRDAGVGCRSVPGGKRRKLRMARNRCARRGLRAQCVRSEQALPGFLAALSELNAARWSAADGGVPLDANARAFHARALPRLLEAQLVQLELLMLQERPVAAYYGLQDARRAHAYLGGFDPEFAFESPGTLLLGRAIESAAGAGRGEFHFLRGRERYKYDWGAVDVWSQRRLFRRRVTAPQAAAGR